MAYRHWVFGATSTAMAALIYWVGYRADRTAFEPLMLAFAGLLGLYAALLRAERRGWFPLRWCIGLGLTLRILLLFSTPNLSDDIYRFLWDGRVALEGIHPFAFTPDHLRQAYGFSAALSPDLFEKLNSPHYYTVYPPVCQAVFWVSARLFPEDTAGGIWIIKLFLLAMEAVTIGVLWCWEPSARAAAAYALHPLVVVEVMGNAHFEGAMMAFLLMGLWQMRRGCWTGAALGWALAVAVKLLPLLFLPIVWIYVPRGSRRRFWSAFVLFSALLFWPLWDVSVVQHLFSSLQLYFRQFAFNASVYYLGRALLSALHQKAILSARLLGPFLGVIVFFGVCWLALRRQKPSFSLTDRLLWASALYLLLATTVHPWYVIVPFTLSLMSERIPAWRFAQVWAACVWLSYSHYMGGAFQEKYGWIALEYFFVGAAIAWDLTRKTKES